LGGIAGGEYGGGGLSPELGKSDLMSEMGGFLGR